MSSTITPSETLATLLPAAVANNREGVAVRHREGTGWRDVSYAEVGDTVTALALGLIALGMRPAIESRFWPRRAPSGRGRLRDLDGRMRRRADISDELAAGVRMGAERLRGRRGDLRGRVSGREGGRHA